MYYQYSFYCTKLEEQRDNIIKDCKKQAAELKATIDEQSKELVTLYEAIKNQYELIRVCEDGTLTNGIKSLKLPSSIQLTLPTSANYK